MALKGKQKKLDKNNNGRIDTGDFALMKKAGYKMGGGMIYANTGASVGSKKYEQSIEQAVERNKTIKAAKEAIQNSKHKQTLERLVQASPLKDEFKDVDRLTQRDIEVASRINKRGNRTGQFDGTDRLTQRDIEAASKINRRKGGMTKAKSGKYLDKYERGLDFHPDPLVRSGKMSKGTYDALDKGLTAAGIVGAGMGATVVGTAFNEARKAKKFSDIRRDYKRSAKLSASEGSFNTGDLADTMKKLRKKAYEKSGKKNKNIGRMGEDEYFIQKKLPGMKTGKVVDVEPIKITPTVGGKPLKSRPFMKSKFDSGTRSRDYKFDKK